MKPGIFWAYDPTWGWMHLDNGEGGLCRLEQALDEARERKLPFSMVSSHTGRVFFDWRF